MYSIIPMKQKSSTKCGIACMYAVTNKDYEFLERKTREILDKREYRGWRTLEEDLKEVLKSAGKKVRIIKKRMKWGDITNKSDLKFAIVGINYKKKSNKWHWVVYQKSKCRYWDPNLNKWVEQKKFRKGYHITSYLKIL